MTLSKPFWIISVILTFFALSSAAQTAKLSSKESSILIKGTSSLHDWRCKTEQISGDINYTATALTLKTIKSVGLQLVVKSMKSIKKNGDYYEAGMDKNMYKALSADKFPKITFVLTNISNLKASPGEANFVANGNLTVAGSQKPISFPVSAVLNNNGITCKGSTTFKMTSFGVKPPKALLGTVKTGDEITIVFNTFFKNQ